MHSHLITFHLDKSYFFSILDISDFISGDTNRAFGYLVITNRIDTIIDRLLHRWNWHHLSWPFHSNRTFKMTLSWNRCINPNMCHPYVESSHQNVHWVSIRKSIGTNFYRKKQMIRWIKVHCKQTIVFHLFVNLTQNICHTAVNIVANYRFTITKRLNYCHTPIHLFFPPSIPIRTHWHYCCGNYSINAFRL